MCLERDWESVHPSDVLPQSSPCVIHVFRDLRWYVGKGVAGRMVKNAPELGKSGVEKYVGPS